jgi:hypothetical protein
MLTPDQQLLAKKEGWKIVSGYVAQAYNTKGQCPFNSVSEIVRFLRTKGKTSEWHRDVYMELPWNDIDEQMSFEEGWYLAYNGILLRNHAKFSSNEAAQAHVQTGIETGDPLHLKAIKTLAKRRLLYGEKQWQL